MERVNIQPANLNIIQQQPPGEQVCHHVTKQGTRGVKGQQMLLGIQHGRVHMSCRIGQNCIQIRRQETDTEMVGRLTVDAYG